MELLPGQKRGYWKYHAPEKWFRQAKIRGKLENHPAVLLLDSGAEVSIVDTTFAREVGCLIDTSMTQECVGIRDETYYTVGRARHKVTLAGNLVYFFEAWVGDLAGQNAILGMDFMVPAGIRLDAGDGTVCLPDEVRVQMLERRPLYGTRTNLIMPDTPPLRIESYRDRDVRLRSRSQDRHELWVTRGKSWVTTLVDGRSPYLRVTNLSNAPLALDTHTKLGMWIAKDQLPREYGFVRIGSRKYQEWQNLVYEAAIDNEDAPHVKDLTPLPERRQYQPPKSILRRGEIFAKVAVNTARPVAKYGPQPTMC
ncbi:hypothetical protein PR003_g28905 [Phytophthora rubi]|uniref:Peptidase A2 domain-containing protein n=1 Tax=Phytophthora rubi TaxID=129364 RepID=A0A6A4BQR5_9STRA|nr:hypothetical protein PR003_g28905 [Phytophthora rubi]